MNIVITKWPWLKSLALVSALMVTSLPQAADREDVVAGVLVGAAAGYILSQHGNDVQVAYRQDYHHRHVSHCRHASHAYSHGRYHQPYQHQRSHYRDDHHRDHRHDHRHYKGKAYQSKLSGHRGWVVQTRTRQ